ncbi:MAG TPA: DUF2178 domain-containing protein [Methanoregulaceae archaeon]|jgi:uncharacterized membrane protein|nr:DUF2178 domain-containing protein [Methanolinea sp.]MCC7566805.1 DUF2178 domain-containing protein [Methanoregulaceae archaeon]MDD3091201.1 DUF2178 domain-containing protein [Methanoregulaceae archaeon]MDD5049228.1 DUF2178 domain-containing protein [Methanoregulaceae archaeon]HOP67629.1 DUF2178 domain-containing protein [Methanoregulaceae archaeon]
MKRAVYLVCILLTVSLVAAMVGWAIAAGALLVPVIAIPLAVVVILACRQQVKGVMSDERTVRIKSKASLRTIEVLLVLGVIGVVVFSSYAFSTPLAPTISGKVTVNDDGTRSLSMAISRGGNTGMPGVVISSITIRNIDAMNETEAAAYAAFWQEGLRQYNESAIVARTILYCLIALITTFGAFYLYYARKY